MNRTLCLAILLFSEFALAKEPRLEERRQSMINQLDKRIAQLQKRKACVETAANMQAIKDCRRPAGAKTEGTMNSKAPQMEKQKAPNKAAQPAKETK